MRHDESVRATGRAAHSDHANARTTTAATETRPHDIGVRESVSECLSHSHLSLSIMSKRHDWLANDKINETCLLISLNHTFPIAHADSPEPQQCTDEQCQEPECQYIQQQQLLQQQEQLQQQQQQAAQMQQAQQQQHHQHQIMQTQPHIHQIHYTYSRRTSLDSNQLDVSCNCTFCSLALFFCVQFSFRVFPVLIFHTFRLHKCCFCFIADESIN